MLPSFISCSRSDATRQRMLNRSYILCYICTCICIVFCSCSSKEQQLFRLLLPAQSGIHFSNIIVENDSINMLDYEYVYNGSGVGIGDFNKDGLPDIYFGGNMVSNRLYLNRGSMRFDDITEQAGVAGQDKWCTGVAVTDINADGWP